MIQIVGTVRIPAGSIDAARPAMERMLAASRAEPGCLRYSYAVDVLDEGLVHVVEAWADRDALAAHFQTPHMAEWRAEFAALGISDRDLRLYETDEGEPI
ncbi:MAG: antibiotic biosynthesis monooxygenase [Sphingomonadaceae bacterium]|nr:antibiotic biosynthesis monooxygenase [Sphingomonadaceae bacterium]MCP5393890.1 antibiotic biosynthesis monooxygenase [Sphingomonadaceae bacterium]